MVNSEDSRYQWVRIKNALISRTNSRVIVASFFISNKFNGEDGILYKKPGTNDTEFIPAAIIKNFYDFESNDGFDPSKSNITNLTLDQKKELLLLLYNLGVHLVWEILDVQKWLLEIKIKTELSEDFSFLIFFGEKIYLVNPEFGESGIYAPHILSVLLKLENINFVSNKNGRSTRHKEYLNKLAERWNIDLHFET